MAKLIINSFIRDQIGADGSGLGKHLNIEANSVRKLITKLDQQFPGVAPKLETNVAVAIDGEIYQDALFEPLDEESEVYFLPAIEGG